MKALAALGLLSLLCSETLALPSFGAELQNAAQDILKKDLLSKKFGGSKKGGGGKGGGSKECKKLDPFIKAGKRVHDTAHCALPFIPQGFVKPGNPQGFLCRCKELIGIQPPNLYGNLFGKKGSECDDENGNIRPGSSPGNPKGTGDPCEGGGKPGGSGGQVGSGGPGGPGGPGGYPYPYPGDYPYGYPGDYPSGYTPDYPYYDYPYGYPGGPPSSGPPNNYPGGNEIPDDGGYGGSPQKYY